VQNRAAVLDDGTHSVHSERFSKRLIADQTFPAVLQTDHFNAVIGGARHDAFDGGIEPGNRRRRSVLQYVLLPFFRSLIIPKCHLIITAPVARSARRSPASRQLVPQRSVFAKIKRA
jgi:hypothetical protein